MIKNPYLEALFQTPDLFAGILDEEGRLLDANQAALDFIDKELEELKRGKFWETPWWDHSNQLQNELRGKIEDARDGEASRLEVEHFLPEGDKVTVDFILRPVAEQSDTP